MREWEIGAVENIHGALPYIRFAPILALVGVGVNRIGKRPSLGIMLENLRAISTEKTILPILFTVFIPPKVISERTDFLGSVGL